MKPFHERLDYQLEQTKSCDWQNGQHPSGLLLPTSELENEPEVENLVVLARRLQATPHIQVDPNFSQQLKRRMLRRHAELRLQATHKRYSFLCWLRVHRALGIVLSLCLLFLALGSSILTLAAQVSNPTNPLYTIKSWEQHLQVSLTRNPADRAALALQLARDRLNTLPSLTDPAHEETYRQTLADLDMQLNAATSAIAALPRGASRTHLTDELASLKRDTIQVLHRLLPRLTLSGRLITTDELDRLGDNVLNLASALLILPTHSNGHATISIVGSNIQARAQLLVDGRLIKANGTLQNGQITFVVNWYSNQQPQSLGLLNPDDTSAQTTAFTVERSGANGNSGDNQNGNENKPSVTPAPNGHKPSVVPTPNRKK